LQDLHRGTWKTALITGGGQATRVRNASTTGKPNRGDFKLGPVADYHESR
jgi:hypothetical protein